MKKFLFTLLLLTSVFVMAGCGGNRNLPEISDPDGVYLTAKEGQYTYTLTNRHMYDKLKKQVGGNMLLDMVDKDLLKATKKDGTSFWDLITQDDIDEELEADLFPNGTEDMSEEEQDERRTEYFNNLFISYGLLDMDAINDYYHLELAKKRYAREMYNNEEIKETDLEQYFENNYKQGYYAIVVSYESIKLYQIALEQLGYKIDSSGTWLKNTAELTDSEIVKAFIDLYNSKNQHKLENYPNETLTLQEGTHYTVSGGVFTFDLDAIDMLHFEHGELNAVDSTLPAYLKDQMISYPEEGNWYTNRPLTLKKGSMHTFVLKIADEVFDYNELKDEVKEKYITSKLTNTYIQTQMAKLRAENDFVIYDDDIERTYINTAASYKVEYKETKKSEKTLVAQTSGKTYSADDLFHLMNKNYGISIAVSEIDYIRFISNPSLNTIYDYASEGEKDSDRVLDENKWKVIQQDVKSEKTNFEADAYADYGYPKSFGWENFLRQLYGVRNEEELALYFLYRDVREEFVNTLGDLSDADANSDMWKFYQRNMQKMADEFFSVKGVELFITVLDESKTEKKVEDWTDLQKEYAEELYEAVMQNLKSVEPKDYTDKLEEIENAFIKAPFFMAGIGQDSNSQVPVPNANYVFEGIEVSKYKTAGLSISYKELGSFRNGVREEEFDAAVKSIWVEDPKSDIPTVYGIDPDTEGNYDYLATENGYHVYVNLESFELVEWEAGKVIPTLEQIKLYIEDEDNDDLKDIQITAIKTYYIPIHDELVDTSNVNFTLYTAIRNLNLTFGHEDYTVAQLHKYLDLQIEKSESELIYE